MNNIWIIIILIVVLICCFTTSAEGFDGRISDITEAECGDACSKTYGCAGFSYDSENKKCFISKSPILGSPGNSLYTDSYDANMLRCNKRGKIDLGDVEDEDSRVQNALYMCANQENGEYKPNLVLNNIFQELPNDLPVSIDEYELHELEWPEYKKDLELSYSQVAEVQGTGTDSPVENKYLISDKEHLGQYMHSHQCVANTSIFECLKACDKSSECKGCEWNPMLIQQDEDTGQYTMYENVCCPKREIKEIIDRREKFKRGKYYIKLTEDQSNDLAGLDNVTLLK